MSEVIALLDRPSAQSMGAVPFVSATAERTMAVRGLTDTPSLTISHADLQDLLQTRQAVRIRQTQATVFASDTPTPVAMWIGSEFDSRAAVLGVPVPPLPSMPSLEASGGRAAIASSPEVFARLEAWIERAFRSVVATRDNSLAKLMTQVMPDNEFTQAALWYSADSEKRRSMELDWFIRLGGDAGRKFERRELEDRFNSLCQNPPWARVKVVALVSGLSGSRHSVAAKQLATAVASQRRNSSMVSFGEFLRKRWMVVHRRSPTKPDLQKFGQEFVESGAFLFARQVLAQIDSYPEFLVVDGVRHGVIKEAIEFIANKPTLDYRVDTPEEVLIKHLIDQVGASAIPLVRSAQTEDEARKLLAHFSQRIHYGDSEPENQKEVRQASTQALEKMAAVG